MWKSVWALDATPSTAVMKGPARRARAHTIRWLRHSVQTVFAVLVVWIGVDFVRWVAAIERGDLTMARPAGVESFLPISGLISLRHLFRTGEVHPVHPAALVLLLTIVGTSFLLKKSSCSWVCPVGTISEALGEGSLAVFRRRLKLPRLLDLPLRAVKYLLLLFFVYAIFISMSGEDLATFLASPHNQIADVKMLDFFASPSPLTIKVIVALILISIAIPYAWCRYLCPYGALLGFISLFSPLRSRATRQAASTARSARRRVRRTCRWSASGGCRRTSASGVSRAWRRARSPARCGWKRRRRSPAPCARRCSRSCCCLVSRSPSEARKRSTSGTAASPTRLLRAHPGAPRPALRAPRGRLIGTPLIGGQVLRHHISHDLTPQIRGRSVRNVMTQDLTPEAQIDWHTV